MDKKEQLIRLIEKLKVHDHLCLIYSSKEEEFAAVVPFVRIGLERGERCIYIADDNTVAEVLDSMRKNGIDIDSCIRSEAFIISTKKDAYLKQGYFDPDCMINFLKQSTDEAKKAGFPVLRVTGEMTWALGDDVGVERLIEYESKLNYFILNSDIIVICQYNYDRFSPEVMRGVIETHPLVIYNYSIGKNFYYLPPDEFLKPGQEKKKVERLLKNIFDREQAEDALRTAALYTRNLIEASLDPLVTIDLYGKITDVNKATESATGVSREKLIGSDFADYFTNPEDAREGYSQVFSHGVVRDYPLTIRHVSGRTTDVLYNASVYKDAEGKGQGVFAAARDITESKRAERLVRHLSDVLQTVNDIDRLMLYEHDASRLMTEACEILLRTRGYVLAWVGTVEDGHKRVVPMARAGKKTDYLDEVTITWDDSDTGRGPTGTAIRTHRIQVCRDMATDPNFAPWREAALARAFASSAVLPMIHGGKVFGVLSVYSNKTGFFDEEELELLAGLVDDLAYALHNIEIESERKKIEHMKDVLIRDVSHSLKTPIALAKMGVNMLDRGLEGTDTKRINEAQKIIRDNIEAAHRDITSILDLYIMEQGKKIGRREQVSLGKIVKEVMTETQYIITRKGLETKVNVPENADKIMADNKEIKMLIFNVVGNAVKFTEVGSVSVSAKIDGKMVEVTVTDTGCGIADEEKNKLFQRFYQRHASIDGVGLGLTICKEIVGRHDGTIEVKSEGVGKGTTVTIRLPKD